MGGLTGAVQWWEESQLRVLVLASLGVQYFLTIFAGGRKFSVPSWFRFAIWLSYLGSDALAIYALATLFNREKPSSSHGSSRDLEVLWVPFLLMHLGGQVFITAYNMEDNELWRRYIVTALSQVAVALYVFGKSWSLFTDSKLKATAVLIFIPGILKCFAKPWALMYASFNSLANSFILAERIPAASREEELQQYVQAARFSVSNENELSDNVKVHNAKLYVPQKLFVDFPHIYSHRLTNLRSFCALSDNEVCSLLQDSLSNVFDLLYTKTNMLDTDNYRRRDMCGGWTWLLSLFLPIVSIVLFHISHKEAYRKDDVAVTIVLLYSTIVLEFFSVCILGIYESEWPDIVAQRSILGQFAHNKRHYKLMLLASGVRCKDSLIQHWSMDSCRSAEDLTMSVRRHVQDGWTDYITDAESYREFNDMRGQWTLEREGCHIPLSWSIDKPFDESVLLWHIATDLCFHQMGATFSYSQSCREMSNYMMHLLIDNPEMLMPGSRRSLFAVAYSELEAVFAQSAADTLMEEDKVAKQLIDKVKSAYMGLRGVEWTYIYDGCVLAEMLMDLGGEKMWKVINGVWLEMMCFSAGRCRGYLHAKAMGSGGEYLSHVWLMLAYLGLETFPDRLQRTKKLHSLAENVKHFQSGDEDVDGPSTSQGTEEENTTAPSVSPGLGEEEIAAAPSISREEEVTAGPSTSEGDCAMKIVVSP